MIHILLFSLVALLQNAVRLKASVVRVSAVVTMSGACVAVAVEFCAVVLDVVNVASVVGIASMTTVYGAVKDRECYYSLAKFIQI